jgi:hypothetical protein
VNYPILLSLRTRSLTNVYERLPKFYNQIVENDGFDATNTEKFVKYSEKIEEFVT